MTTNPHFAAVSAKTGLSGPVRMGSRRAFAASLLSALLVSGLLASCNATGGAIVRIEDDTPQETVVSAEGSGSMRREVRAYCTPDATVLELGAVRLQVLGHRGYRGKLSITNGDVTIGGVRILYDEREITINGPFTAGTYPARVPATLTVDPSGAVRRG